MSEIPFHAGDTAELELGTDFDPKTKVTIHIDAKPFETADDGGGKQHRAYDTILSWDENIAPTEKKEKDKPTHSIVAWKAATQSPAGGNDAKPVEVSATLYGKAKDGTAVSTTVKDTLLVVPGLIDAGARFQTAATAGGLSTALDPATRLYDFDTPCVRDGPAGWGRWNGAETLSVPLDGELRTVEAKKTPKLFGLYIPKGVKAGTGPIDFFVFFHPAITGPAGFPAGEKPYPYAARYIQCVLGYTFMGAHQLQLAKRDVVYVFPMGSITQQLNDFTQGKVLLQFLKDLCVYLGRFAGFQNTPAPREVGRVAVGCFSFGANHMNALMDSSPAGTEFYDKHWFEAYHYDPVPVPDLQPTYGPKCAKWWNKGKNDRCVRLYAQPNGWDFWGALWAAMGQPKAQTCYGARQIDVPNATVLGTTLSFWEGMFNFPGTDKPKIPLGFFDIHGWFPALFQYHSLKNSLFRKLP